MYICFEGSEAQQVFGRNQAAGKQTNVKMCLRPEGEQKTNLYLYTHIYIYIKRNVFGDTISNYEQVQKETNPIYIYIYMLVMEAEQNKPQ